MSGSYPMLRPGVTYFIEHSPNQSLVHVGTEESSTTLNGHTAIMLIPKCDGNLDLDEITEQLQITQSELLMMLQPLVVSGLLVLLQRPFLKNNHENLSARNSIARAQAELNLIIWRGRNDPQTALFKRSEKKILITDSSNLSLAIYSLLLASGFTNVKIEIESDKRVEANQINGQPFSTRDIGAPLKSALREKQREIALNLDIYRPETSDFLQEGAVPDLVLSSQNLKLDRTQRLMAEGIAHLQISNFVAGKIEVGPLVIPGKTPCLNCIELWKSSENDLNKISLMAKLDYALPTPVATTSFISGLVVGLMDNFFAENQSFLIGSSLLLDLNRPLNYLERFWQPHPRCGCLELL